MSALYRKLSKYAMIIVSIYAVLILYGVDIKMKLLKIMIK